ncbi:MAG: hypothetical protein WCO55_04105 [Candidatus Falkowbacteria bacterium]
MPHSADSLSKAIRHTVLWFSLFDYPLTAAEILNFLPLPATADEIAEALDNLPAELERKNGFYFPVGRAELINERQRRYNYSERKFRRAKRLFNVFGYLPWIKLIAVANLMGSHNLRDQGDIDIFIITAPRRLWLTRLILAGSLKLLNLRPTANHSRDTFCLSFLAAADSLDFADLRLPDGDMYFNYWLACLTPLCDKNNAYRQLLDANVWLAQALPNLHLLEPSARRRLNIRNYSSGSNQWDKWEQKTADWQIGRLPANLKKILNQDTRVIANERIIKMHLNDRRILFAEKFEKLAT